MAERVEGLLEGIERDLAELVAEGGALFAMARDRTGAERARRRRERRACGIRVVAVEVSVEALQAAERAGLLEASMAQGEIAFLLGEFLERMLARAAADRRREQHDET